MIVFKGFFLQDISDIDEIYVELIMELEMQTIVWKHYQRIIALRTICSLALSKINHFDRVKPLRKRLGTTKTQLSFL